MVVNGAFHLVDVGRVWMSLGHQVGNRLRRSVKAALVTFLCTSEEPAQPRAGLGFYPCQCRVQTPWRDWGQVVSDVTVTFAGDLPPCSLTDCLVPFVPSEPDPDAFSQITVADLAAKKPFNYPFDFVRHILFLTHNLRLPFYPLCSASFLMHSNCIPSPGCPTKLFFTSSLSLTL